jgi:integrase
VRPACRKRPGSTTCITPNVVWAVASGADLPYIQAQLGHESITTTIDTYGHLMPNSNRHVTHAFDRALRGGKIERYEGLTVAQ